MLNFKNVLYALVLSFFFISNNVLSESIVFEEETLDENTAKITSTLDLDIPLINFTTAEKTSHNFKMLLDFEHLGSCEVKEGEKTEADCKGNVKGKLYWTLSTIEVIKNEITEGKKLYNNACALCHNLVGSSSQASTDPDAIRAAIVTNTGGMSSFSSLTDEDLANISEYLKTLASIKTATTDEEKGKAVYDKACLACHQLGSLASDTSANASFTSKAINDNVGGMGSLSYLSATDIENIAKYILSLLVIE